MNGKGEGGGGRGSGEGERKGLGEGEGQEGGRDIGKTPSPFSSAPSSHVFPKDL